MKRFLSYCAVVVLVVSLVTCASTMGTTKWDDPDYATMVDDIDGYAMWTKVNDQTITGDATGLLGGGAHAGADGFREVYINKTGLAVSTGEKDYPYPVGTIIVKQTYANDMGDKGAIANLTIMIKRKGGYHPDHGDWEYMMVSPDLSQVMVQGTPDGCVNCHANISDQDYVFNSKRMSMGEM